MFAVYLDYIAFIMFIYVLWTPDLSKTFNMNQCYILLKAVSASNDHVVSFLGFVYIVYYVEVFVYIKQSLYP